MHKTEWETLSYIICLSLFHKMFYTNSQKRQMAI